MINIDWKQDYHREFICPHCAEKGLTLQGITNNKRKFKCKSCKKYTLISCDVKIDTNTVQSKINWRTDYRVGEFACPNPDCDDRNVKLSGKDCHSGKKNFQCQTCLATALESNELTYANLSKYSNIKPQIKPFNFNDSQWDLRAINLSYSERTRIIIIGQSEVI